MMFQEKSGENRTPVKNDLSQHFEPLTVDESRYLSYRPSYVFFYTRIRVSALIAISNCPIYPKRTLYAAPVHIPESYDCQQQVGALSW